MNKIVFLILLCYFSIQSTAQNKIEFPKGSLFIGLAYEGGFNQSVQYENQANGVVHNGSLIATSFFEENFAIQTGIGFGAFLIEGYIPGYYKNNWKPAENLYSLNIPVHFIYTSPGKIGVFLKWGVTATLPVIIYSRYIAHPISFDNQVGFRYSPNKNLIIVLGANLDSRITSQELSGSLNVSYRIAQLKLKKKN